MIPHILPFPSQIWPNNLVKYSYIKIQRIIYTDCFIKNLILLPVNIEVTAPVVYNTGKWLFFQADRQYMPPNGSSA